MSFLRGLLRLLGFRIPEETQAEREAAERWMGTLERYRTTLAQVREASSPDELAVAHAACQAAQADLEWQIRLAKQDRGLPVRTVAENQRAYEELLHRLRGAPEPPRGRGRRWRRIQRRRKA